MDKCFKRFMGNIYVVKEATLTVDTKPFLLVILYRGSIYLQNRTKLRSH